MVKPSRSRSVVSTALAKVRSRISSIGSATSQAQGKGSPEQGKPEAPGTPTPPDGLIATPPCTTATALPSQPAASPPPPPPRPETDEAGLGLPQISTLVITPSTWSILADPSYPEYAATAYVQFTLTCQARNALQCRKDVPSLLQNVPGCLLNLSLEMNVTGAHTIIQDFTQTDRPRLEPDGTWLCLVHLGFHDEDSSLASKLSASWRSLRSRTSSSLKRYNLDTIDQWLAILSADQERDRAGGIHDQVSVRVRVRYQHSFLPNGDSGTWLEDSAECRVSLTHAGCWGTSSGGKRSSAGEGTEITCDSGEEDMILGERARECNVIVGPPFML